MHADFGKMASSTVGVFLYLVNPKHFLQTFFLTEVINFSRFVQLHFYIFPFLKCSSKVLMLSEQS